MKVTPHKGTREVHFHRAMADLSHDHLLKCLASFVFSSKYHMIYEKADCNVEEFMKRNANPRKLPNFTTVDLAQQLFGLADALCFIHNQGSSDSREDTTLLSVPKKSSRKSGYIHDIKPENLLMFIYNGPGGKAYWFRMSDFSCAKVVDILETVSGKDRDSWKTASRSGTPVYRAPEAITEGRTSRPYDLFSLGCVFLELLVWFLDDYYALKAFRDQRECLLSPDTYEDEGFYYKPTEDEQFRLREPVSKKIEDVRSRCSGALKVIADVIPKLLQMDPQQRPTAQQLVAILKPIDNGAKPPLETDRRFNDPLLTPPDNSGSDSDSSFGDLVRIQHPTEE
jgi:serine/threonine protein kinase